ISLDYFKKNLNEKIYEANILSKQKIFSNSVENCFSKINNSIYDILKIKNFELGEINHLNRNYKKIENKISEFKKIKKGPLAKIMDKEGKIFFEINDKYSNFIEQSFKLSRGMNLFAIIDIDEVSENYKSILSLHEEIKANMNNFDDNLKSKLNGFIIEQKNKFENRVNEKINVILENVEKIYANNKNEEYKYKKGWSKIKSLEDIAKNGLMIKETKIKYNELLDQQNVFEKLINSKSYKLKKLINNINLKKLRFSVNDKKEYHLDTNVLIHDPYAWKNFEENTVVISNEVIGELNKITKDSRKQRIHREARLARNEIANIIENRKNDENLFDGIKINKYGGTLKIMKNYSEINRMPIIGYRSSLDLKNPDNKIIEQANIRKRKGNNVFFVSNDVEARVTAESLEISAQSYLKDQIQVAPEDLFMGYRTVKVDKEVIEKYNQTKELNLENFYSLINNEIIILQDKNDPKYEKMLRYNESKFHDLITSKPDFGIFGGKIKPRNQEQMFALEGLLHDDINVICLTGQAGTGKDFLSIAAGLQKYSQGMYDKLLATRSLNEVGDPMGFLPGKVSDKINPYFDFAKVNLESIARETKIDFDDFFDATIADVIEYKPINFMRGTTFHKRYALISEAQNLTPHQIKTIVTRAGMGTKIIFNGDPTQIDVPHLTQYNNGLNHLRDRYSGQSNFMALTLVKSERSPLAQQGADLL
ncbi:hypothetical protein HN415_08985, partial [Candidatus Woesearchaeota archaeon]|nr:hypothetical protein [Candidatus Woesearchaeota archaeon]